MHADEPEMSHASPAVPEYGEMATVRLPTGGPRGNLA